VRIAICDDDTNMQQRLTDVIEDWAAARKVETAIFRYPSAEAFIAAWPEDVLFDLVFLDIQMKSMSGIELAHYIRKTDKNMMIVFVTSFSQYSLKGYDVNALHYLIKPLSPAKLLPIMDKAYTIWNSRREAMVVVSNENAQMKLLLLLRYPPRNAKHKIEAREKSANEEGLIKAIRKKQLDKREKINGDIVLG
jgi:two-component SAPR family response regulator